MIESIALSTVSAFRYAPSSEEIRKIVGKQVHKDPKKLPKAIEEINANDNKLRQKYKDASDDLTKKELAKPFIKRNVEGDASETGLVKFVQPLLMGGPYGCYNMESLDAFRKKHPIMEVNGNAVQIPFSSLIKFNAMVRDMNPAVRKGASLDNNMTIYLKGAPERVVNRCTTVLTKDEDNNECETDKTSTMQRQIDAANKIFGGMGERVLAFARLKLDPNVFDKTYKFNIGGWKEVNEIQDMPSNPDGWFPMWGLQLVGLCSLNDPPRPGVDLSVESCKKAGIKVIMVTGD